MGPADAIKTCLGKLLKFQGRASQAEFWWYALSLVTITGLLLAPYASVLGVESAFRFESEQGSIRIAITPSLGLQPKWHLYKIAWNPVSIAIVACFYSLIVAATVRRLHDVGSSGWFGVTMLLLGPIARLLMTAMVVLLWRMSPGIATLLVLPMAWISWLVWLICPIILIILLSRPSEDGETEYGPNPREVTS